jgi:signal transduction histidine kinase
MLDFEPLFCCTLVIVFGLKGSVRSGRFPGLRSASARPWIFIFMLMAGWPLFAAQPPPELLTNAFSVISLPAEKAALFLPVKVTGVVTAADPSLKGGRFFVQDSSGGVFVDNAIGQRPEPGDLVEVSGLTHPGAYAPIITAPTVRKIGVAALPAAKPVSIEQLMSGAEDSQRIEISGIVHNAWRDGPRVELDLVTGGYRYLVYVVAPGDFQPDKLPGAEVIVRGTAAEEHNRSLRQLIRVDLYVPQLSDLVVKKPEPIDPFDRPAIPLGMLAQYQPGNSLSQRVHVRGVVTLQKPGECVYLQDLMGGLPVQSRQPIDLSPGETVDAVGFVSFENFLPALQDAVFRKTQVPLVTLTPIPTSIAELQNGLFRADYISLTGRLIERTVSRGRQESGPAGQTTLVLQNTNFTFTASTADQKDHAELAAIPIGSEIKVSGICLTEIDASGKLKSFQILVGNPNDIQVIKKPSWLTPQRLLFGLAILGFVLIVIVTWTVTLSRKNSILRYFNRELENAHIALQQANDQLEARVKKRTAELKFQTNAREESEVRFKAVLTERTRLAQELHDTVEQTLTGIAFQLDTALKLRLRNPDHSLRLLELARTLMTKSQTEMRQSVWDLRVRAMEQFDLPKELAESARQSADGTDIQVHIQTQGEPRYLPEIVEENLLRIGQEACANAVKHSSASGIHIELEFHEDQVVLQIKDDGRGFNPQIAPGPRQSHFGLLGISERAKRIGGRFILETAPGQGTIVRVEIPSGLACDLQPPADGPNPISYEEARENSSPNC